MSRSSPVLTRLLPGRLGALACILLMAGCAAIAPATPDAPASPSADAGVANEVPGVPAASAAPAPPSTTRRDVNARLPPAAPSAGPPAATTAQTAPVASGRAVIPPAASTNKATATVEAPPKVPAPAAAVAKPAATPALDLESLETRLKETKAVGVFTKLALKNQIDELLDKFRAHYQGRLQTSLAELRRSFDMLVLKVVALLQDADPPLARAIVASRESLWGVLSDPAKFKAL